jgi:Uma2 family endonuclease
MAMGAVNTLLTFEEFERKETKPGKQELIRGELLELPPPELKHQKISRRIFKPLDTAVEQAHARGEAKRLGVNYYETGYKFSGNSYLIPDLSVTHAGQTEAKYLEGAPAIAIEILSPDNSSRLMEAKSKVYFEFGALEVGYVDLRKRRVTIYYPDGSSAQVQDGAVTTPLIPGFLHRLADVFGA